jgi:hypothetical protein
MKTTSSGESRRRPVAVVAAVALTAACTGLVGPAARLDAKLGGDGGTGDGEADGGTAWSGPVALTAGVRRLTMKEAQAAVEALLGVSGGPFTTALGTDTRQTGFTRNAAQAVSSVQADALWQAAAGLAQAAVTDHLATLAPCSNSNDSNINDSDTCAKSFIRTFAARAFRRTPTAGEEAQLFTVYTVGRTQEGTYAGGVQLVIAAVLQSPSFLYVTELGEPTGSDGGLRLTGEELANELAFLFTGGPPSDALLDAGRTGALATADGREAVVRQLLSTAAGRAQVERFVLEWFGQDTVDTVSKDGVLYPEWPSYRADVLAESKWIIDATVIDGDGTLKSLLTTPTSSVTPALAKFYGDYPAAGGQVTLPPARRGLLLTAGFLAANSQPASTAPVKRGAGVRKKLLCQTIPVPTTLGVITVPEPDPTKTTRERFDAHSQTPACAGCHAQLDPIGFSMEGFDPVGRFRSTENGKPVDTTGTLLNAGDATGGFDAGVDLLARLAESEIVKDCVPRQVYRYASGRNGGHEEETFFQAVRAHPAKAQANIIELLVDWARSDSFIERRTE